MIQLQNISISFGGRVLFKDLDCHIGNGSRIGLVGRNGTGKTTLLRIIYGEMHSETGTISKAKFANIGYLPQENPDIGNKSILEEVRTCKTDNEDWQCKKILMGLGFKEKDFNRLTSEFSGGWQMRVAMAKLLLQKPWLLMMDEPTNHLDIESLRWLENFLIDYDGAVLLVSHDRRFLNNITKTTFELFNNKLHVFSGNYSFYKKEKELRLQQLLAEQKNQQAAQKQVEKFIERFRYKATKAAQVQSRIKMLEKKEKVEIPPEERKIKVNIPEPPKSGDIVTSVENMHKSYGDINVLQDISFKIVRGDKIGFLGANGEGKSTLARILAGTEPFQQGTVKLGYNVIKAYFAQDQAKELDPTSDLMQIMEGAGSELGPESLRTILGAFLFSGDDVFKKVSVLSGGEKNRLALARIVITPANFLIMDEPTNHLDMESKDILQEALVNYSGTCVIVSHDRDFLDPIVNKIYEVKNGEVLEYLGNCSDYIYRKEHQEDEKEDTKTTKISSYAEEKRRRAEEIQNRSRLLKPIKEKISEIEVKIAQLEDEKKKIEDIMNNGDFYSNPEQIKNFTSSYNSIKKDLEQLYRHWEDHHTELEKIENAFNG